MTKMIELGKEIETILETLRKKAYKRSEEQTEAQRAAYWQGVFDVISSLGEEEEMIKN